jgi:hypothetical protein
LLKRLSASAQVVVFLPRRRFGLIPARGLLSFLQTLLLLDVSLFQLLCLSLMLLLHLRPSRLISLSLRHPLVVLLLPLLELLPFLFLLCI